MKWVYGLLCLFFLILFHEFGHFIAAKIFGVKVESFSVGFGPVLLHKEVKGTDYRLSLFPLGGYCGMKGEKDFQKAIDNNLKYIEADSDSLYGIHPVKRAVIGFAGPFFNFIFAIIAFSLINLIGFTYYTYSNKILLSEEVMENSCTVAKDAGLLSNDIIIEIDGKEISDFSDIISQISTKPEEYIEIKVLRNSEILTFNLKTELNKEQGTGKIGIAADTSTLIKKESEKYNIFTALFQGTKDTFDSIKLTFKSFKILFKGVEVKNAVSGPARVTDLLGTTVKEGFSESIRTGFASMFNLMAIISISLFIMNLLPIPILDGGIILIALIEFIFRKKINPKFQYYIQFIGLAFIIFLFILGTFSDFSYFFNRG